jgi:hypothetical protein
MHQVGPAVEVVAQPARELGVVAAEIGTHRDVVEQQGHEIDAALDDLIDLGCEGGPIVTGGVVDRQAGRDGEADPQGALGDERLEARQHLGAVGLAPALAVPRIVLRGVHVLVHAPVVAPAHDVGACRPAPRRAVEALDQPPGRPGRCPRSTVGPGGGRRRLIGASDMAE